jgi:hypothetical protein
LTSAVVPQKAGYDFHLSRGLNTRDGQLDCSGEATASGFYASARPRTFPVTGRRAFALNASQVIWQVRAPTPPTEPFGPPAEGVN